MLFGQLQSGMLFVLPIATFSIAALPACGMSDSPIGTSSSTGSSSASGGGSLSGSSGTGAAAATGTGSAGNGGGGALGAAGSGGAATGGGGAAGAAPGSRGGAAGAGGAVVGMGGAPNAGVPGVGAGPLVSPQIFGINYWAERDTEALWPIVQASGVTLVRFGGAGPDNEQPTNQRYADVAAGIRAIGAEPYLQISRHFNATRAAQIVDFVNNTQQQHVVYWSINNEPDLGTNEPLMSVADSASLILSLSSAMKAVDPTIQIFAPEIAFYNEAYLLPMLGGASDITGKDANGHYYIDGVTFHTYPFNANFTRDQAVGGAARFATSVNRLLPALASANQKNGRTGTAALQWALTEFNMTFANPVDNSVDSIGVNSFLNGQYFAEMYGIGMAHGAVTLATWSIHESNGNRGSTDLGFLDGPTATARPRSSYYHLQFLAQNFRGRYAPATSSAPLLRVVASGDGSHVSVLLLNESLDQNYDFGVRLDNGALAQPRPVTVAIDTAVHAEYASTIPAQSTLLLVFDAAGNLTKRMDYAIADARAATPPRIGTP